MQTSLLWCWLLIAVFALRPSGSSSTDGGGAVTATANSSEPLRLQLHQNSTEEQHSADRSGSGRSSNAGAADSGELDYREDGGGGGGGQSATDSGRVAELYEDLEDSVVFEDSEGHGTNGGGRMLDEHLVPAASGSAEEYDAMTDGGTEEDAAAAGTSTVVVQRSVKYPEYVRSSSYRRAAWPGGNVTRPEELFRFWDPYEWAPTTRVSAQCVEHMEQYQSALRNGKMWAFKSKSSYVFLSRRLYFTSVCNVSGVYFMTNTVIRHNQLKHSV